MVHLIHAPTFLVFHLFLFRLLWMIYIILMVRLVYGADCAWAVRESHWVPMSSQATTWPGLGVIKKEQEAYYLTTNVWVVSRGTWHHVLGCYHFYSAAVVATSPMAKANWVCHRSLGLEWVMTGLSTVMRCLGKRRDKRKHYSWFCPVKPTKGSCLIGAVYALEASTFPEAINGNFAMWRHSEACSKKFVKSQ